jgi:mono/diheme cytochrome c family protein
MTRKVRARWLAAATTAAVVVFATVFAGLRNVRDEAVSPPSAARPSTAATTAAGAARPVPPAFERLRCSGCHSIGGIGNPSSPLDGIGARMGADEIRDWTLATGRARGELSARTAQRKSQAADDPELQALIDYLAASR